MNKLSVKIHNQLAGYLTMLNDDGYEFTYTAEYIHPQAPPVSLTMPIRQEPYTYPEFPAFFDGLLPEGIQLEGLLKNHKIDRTDYMAQLLAVGSDLVGAVTVGESK